MTQFNVGDRVAINYPGDRYHDLLATIDHFDPSDNTYHVILDYYSQPRGIWVHGHQLVRHGLVTLKDLVPGDHLVNRAGLPFEVVLPPSVTIFLRAHGQKDMIHMSLEELSTEGFKRKN